MSSDLVDVFLLSLVALLNPRRTSTTPPAQRPRRSRRATSACAAAAAPTPISLKVTSYPSESAAKNAIAQAKVWGALIPGTPNTLLNVGSQSDLAALPLTQAFEKAAKSQGQELKPQTYNPTPLASGDPYAIVLAILLTPLLLCGNLCATFLRTATGVAAERYRGLVILGFAIVMALVFDLIACVWLGGIPSDKFWIVWPIMALILAVVGLFAAVMGRLFGAAGTLVAIIVIILFGKPSAGGANGVPFLPGFWLAIGPYLPPRKAEPWVNSNETHASNRSPPGGVGEFARKRPSFGYSAIPSPVPLGS